VLRAVSLQACPGQVVAVTGENGSGKTTLLRICAGLETADTGTIDRHAAAVRSGDLSSLRQLLTIHPGLASAPIGAAGLG
jgi:ABC-type sulfate/molybdate transport systems ATPase subunit